MRGSDGSLIARLVPVLGFPSGSGVPVARVEGQWRKQGSETWAGDIFDRGERLAFPDVDTGETNDIRWRSLFPRRKAPEWATATETITCNTTPSSAVTGLAATLENFAVRLRWSDD